MWLQFSLHTYIIIIITIISTLSFLRYLSLFSVIVKVNVYIYIPTLYIYKRHYCCTAWTIFIDKRLHHADVRSYKPVFNLYWLVTHFSDYIFFFLRPMYNTYNSYRVFPMSLYVQFLINTRWQDDILAKLKIFVFLCFSKTICIMSVLNFQNTHIF